jgi:signal transduction histidine kinase/CheY-like chemotaxis protein
VSILALAAAGALAVWFSRTFERSFSIASWTAMALARGEPALLPRSRIREVNVLGNGLRAAATTLKARLEERDQAERLKDEFLMTLSHELRTPLTAITGWARMLATGQIRPGQEVRAVASIDRNAGALTQLVDDLLDVSRSVSGKLRLDLRPTEVVTFLQAAIDTVRPAAAAKGIEIETSLDPAAVSVLGDANRLRQIVWNLMSNAVKFTPAGGAVRVTVTRLDPVAPATGQAKAGSHIQSRSPIVEILVTDTGPGIDAALMPFIFDRFRQGSAGSARPPHGGLGLGLAIVRQFVELHGGTAECWNNDPPPGATFRILLPVGTLERRTALAVPGAWQGGPFRDVARSSTRLDGVGVLVVDDDPEAREQFASILELAGAEVRAATQVDDAISLLHMWSPAVVVTDVEMPDDGYALLQRLIGMPAPRPRAVAVTAHADHEAKKRVLGAGFDAHVEQPIDPAAFVALISTLSSTAPAADVH